MHRYAKIIFSPCFYFGEITLKSCVDMSVEKEGHERAVADGLMKRVKRICSARADQAKLFSPLA
jgi:hypothetical protein